MVEIEADTPDDIEIAPDIDRSDVLEDLEEVMGDARENAFESRVRQPEKQRVRVKWLRGYISAVSEYRKMVKDVRERDQAARIERLENAVDDLQQGDP